MGERKMKDDYNLINSRTIGNYCRSIKHKFNTEELAVWKLITKDKYVDIMQ